MKQYLDLVKNILENGCSKEDRTGTGTKSIFGTQMRFNLQDGFPLVTTKHVHFKSIVHELIWLLSGNTNIKYLKDNGVTIWDEWANEKGDLGPVYGKQWRNWSHVKYFSGNVKPSKHEGWDLENDHPKADVRIRRIDQIKEVIERIKTNPECRRLIVTAWNPSDIRYMALAPCHAFFQFNCRPISLEDRYWLLIEKMNYNSEDDFSKETLETENIPKYYLDCQLYQRSCDVGLGLSYNIASYSLLTHMIAQVTNTVPGEFIWTGGDTHIYNNHIDALKEQLTRIPYSLPNLELNKNITNIDDFKFEDIKLVDYVHHPKIKMDVSV